MDYKEKEKELGKMLFQGIKIARTNRDGKLIPISDATVTKIINDNGDITMEIKLVD
jgi:hypothetical protein